jgi:hypothetical protein
MIRPNGFYKVVLVSGRKCTAHYSDGNWSIPDKDEKITIVVEYIGLDGILTELNSK